MTDPRSTTDPVLKAAIAVWDSAYRFPKRAFDDATRMRKELHDTCLHRPYGWAAMTCGRIAAYREELDFSEVLLTEALGRFHFVGDRYGEIVAAAHLAIPEVWRRNLDHALELALRPFSSGIAFSSSDADLLHNIAAQCYWMREDGHPAILHLSKAYDLVKDSDVYERRSVIVGNMGAILYDLGELDLALSASTEAWRLQLNRQENQGEIKLSYLSNMIRTKFVLGNHLAALKDAELLMGYLRSTSTQQNVAVFAALCETYALDGQVEKAQYCLDQARALSQSNPQPSALALTAIGEATILEGKGQYDSAISLATRLLKQPASIVTSSNHRLAALVLCRCYAALGRKSESVKWKRFAAERGRDRFLGDILSNHLRASLNVEQPTKPLTDQELACLSLSAHGQTSADIALKLGIKTRTVNFHFAKILRKLNALNRQEAIAKASEANLLRRPR